MSLILIYFVRFYYYFIMNYNVLISFYQHITLAILKKEFFLLSH